MKVIHRARGWHAVWTGLASRRALRGDTHGLVAALYALNDSGLLPWFPVTPEWQHRESCPRCGRLTACDRGFMPTVCAACRGEWWVQAELSVPARDRVVGWNRVAAAAACRAWGPPVPLRAGELVTSACWHCSGSIACRQIGLREHVVIHVLAESEGVGHDHR